MKYIEITFSLRDTKTGGQKLSQKMGISLVEMRDGRFSIEFTGKRIREQLEKFWETVVLMGELDK